MNDKGQIHTLEGVAATLLVIFATLYAVQASAVTPTSSSTASQEIEMQIQRMGEDILKQANTDRVGMNHTPLKTAVLNWNTSSGKFEGAESRFYYRGRAPPGVLGETLNKTLSDKGIAYNIDIVYNRASEGTHVFPFVDNGDPSDNAVVARQVLLLYDDDTLGDGTQLVKDDTYRIPDMSPNTGLYNVVVVRITLWRI